MRTNKLKHQSYLVIGAAMAAMSIFGSAKADPYVVTSTAPSPAAGYTMGGYMYNSGGGILVQPMDGSGNIVSASHPLPIGGSFSASVGGFTPNGTYATPLVTTNASGEIALPAGSVIVISNVGTAVAYVNLGTSAGVTATTSATPVPVGGAVAFTIGAFTNVAAITASGTTTLNMSGGSGLFTGLSGVGASGGGGGGGTVTQGPQGTNTSPWFVSPGTSTFPVSGTVAVSGTSTVVLNSALTVTANQGIQGTNTSPWFVSPGTNTFPITGNLTGTSTVALGGTGTVIVAGASQPPLTGTSTVILNSSPTVNQGIGGTNTSPWFVSPGTSTFPVSGNVGVTGTVTAIPGAGTSTVLLASGTNTAGTVAIAGTVPVSGSFSSSISGWTPNGTFVTPFVSTNASSQIALPAGSVDVVSNIGTSVAFVNLGTSTAVTATTSATPIPIGGEVAFTAGSFTNLAAITGSGTTTLNVSGGGGLFSGLGGYSVSGGGGGGTVTQGPQGTSTSPWFVSQVGTSTGVISGTVTNVPSGTQNVDCVAGCSGGTGGGTVTQGPQGTNTSPWFVSPGTSTFPVSGTVAVSTATVGGSVSITGTSTVVLNSNITVNQGTVAGTNTAPWFVSPGTSTFPVSGTVTSVPSGTQTVGGTVAISGTQTNVVSGTVTAIPGAGTMTTFESQVTSTAGTLPAQVVSIQQIGGTGLTTGQIACGTVATVLAAARTQRQTITIENLGTGTVYIGGTAVTTAGGMLLPPLVGASITLPTTVAIDCIATATAGGLGTISYDETY